MHSMSMSMSLARSWTPRSWYGHVARKVSAASETLLASDVSAKACSL